MGLTNVTMVPLQLPIRVLTARGRCLGRSRPKARR